MSWWLELYSMYKGYFNLGQCELKATLLSYAFSKQGNKFTLNVEIRRLFFSRKGGEESLV